MHLPAAVAVVSPPWKLVIPRVALFALNATAQNVLNGSIPGNRFYNVLETKGSLFYPYHRVKERSLVGTVTVRPLPSKEAANMR